MPEERTRRDEASYFGTDEVYGVVKDTTREEVPLQTISLEDTLANETPSLTQITQEEPQALFSGTDEVYDVVKDTTREEVPLQSIHLEHNVAYGETKPSNEQQPVHIVYDTPLLLQQQEDEYSKDTTGEEVPLQSVSLQHNLAHETPSLIQITQEEPQVLFSGTKDAYGVVKDTTREEVLLQSINLEHNVAYGKTKSSNEQQPVHIIYDTPLLLQQQQDEYSKDTTRDEVSLQSISLQDNLANETPSLTQKIQEPQVLYSGTDEVYDVVKDATREEGPLQSIHLEHNVAYGVIKPSNEQQLVPLVYDTPLLLQQEEEEYSNIEYEDTEDEDEDDYI